jgi:FAD/FMN-containing dehydrogenase/Fe-S oxidoreductase
MSQNNSFVIWQSFNASYFYKQQFIIIMLNRNMEELGNALEGEVHFDEATRLMYATDASAYRELPVAVAYPKSKTDIKLLIRYANEHKIGLIPRTAGTSLAGQVVGNGLIIDVSKYMNRILEINESERWVRVEPGIVLDELNHVLAEKNLFFGPETSTSNRCMIGGMLGNNACGSHSLIYGSTRDHTLEAEVILADGTEATFGLLNKDGFINKMQGDQLENHIYQKVYELLSPKAVRDGINDEFPDKRLKRRNTGYAIDLLIDSEPFGESTKPFNFCKILAGSEGTLAFFTSIKLNVIASPPVHKSLVCVHFNSLEEALEANLIALKYKPGAIELMDKTILDCTRANIGQRKNRFFLEGDPEAILIIEFTSDWEDEILSRYDQLVAALKEKNFGYAYPLVKGADINKVWSLRKAGLGVLANIPGDAKPVSVIEDTAVHPELLPQYIADFKKMLEKHKLSCVFHAHIATGELHLRPVLNLKDPVDVRKFRMVAHETAYLVKKFNGSLSGEHGDGRLRGEFIPIIVGIENYKLFKSIKEIWDPYHIFNPGKIVDTPLMDTSLRYEPGREEKQFNTYFRYPEGNVLQLAEKCNGTGDCRKSALIGGTMCPSYQATMDENKTTRARANLLREYLTHSKKTNPFDHEELHDVLDLCLSCKACKSECPSNVDMAKLKAEFLAQYYAKNGIPLRSRVIANIYNLNHWLMAFNRIYNAVMTNQTLGGMAKSIIGFAQGRSIPKLHTTTLRRWIKSSVDLNHRKSGTIQRELLFFIDEFTEFNDVPIGQKAIQLLRAMGYSLTIVNHTESGRAAISKGLLRRAKKLANVNVKILAPLVHESKSLVGIEPSSILTFRDEYPDLVDKELEKEAIQLAKYTYTIDEFLEREMEMGYIKSECFTTERKKIKFHGHCQQKAISSSNPSIKILSLPKNYVVEEIPSGCCGMAGSFGFEKEHFDLSMKVGELVLFPTVRQCPHDTIIAACGTSCRHQIADGTGRNSYHPVEILYDALLAQYK